MMKKHNDVCSHSSITRRDLLRGAAYATLGATLGLAPSVRTNAAKPKPLARVIVVRGDKVLDGAGAVDRQLLEKMLDTGMAELSGEKDASAAWKTYVRAADTVGVKINKMMTPTHQELTDAICDRLKKIGVTQYEAWDRDAAKPEKFTALVNVPGMKSHWLSGVAFSIKNYAGCYPNPSSLHEDSCADLGAMWMHPPIKGKTRLVIVDALRVLYHGGPQVDPRYLWDYGGLILGVDPVAVDAVCLDILQKKRNQTRPPEWTLSPPPKHIAVADTKFKLGTSDLSRIEIVELRV